MQTVFETDLPGLKLLKKGKVRDVYDAGEYLLMVATDRLSAFDVILPDPIPYKGAVLTAVSNFWFDRTKDVIENHIVSTTPWKTDPGNLGFQAARGRSILIKRAEPVMIESVVRGYLAGSGWVEYQKSQTVCGIKLPAGLKESSQLPEPIFTPSTKAPAGSHDENISFEQACDIVGREQATQVRDASLALYSSASAYARERGIIIADTKFEFGISGGKMIVIDEMLTPDSSRFWPMESYAPGGSPPSFDKQFVRDYLLSIKWNKKPPAPKLPVEIIKKTSEKYREALVKITGIAALEF
jgi:phosphoribosylaminoimidazole-succinocarboxamide synthase